MRHSAVDIMHGIEKLSTLSSNESFNRKPGMSFEILRKIYNLERQSHNVTETRKIPYMTILHNKTVFDCRHDIKVSAASIINLFRRQKERTSKTYLYSTMP